MAYQRGSYKNKYAGRGSYKSSYSRKPKRWSEFQMASFLRGMNDYLNGRAGYSGMGITERQNLAAAFDPSAKQESKTTNHLERFGARVAWLWTRAMRAKLLDPMVWAGMALKLAAEGAKLKENDSDEEVQERYKDALECLGFSTVDLPTFLEPEGDDGKFDEAGD